jgi:hypothetical protein
VHGLDPLRAIEQRRRSPKPSFFPSLPPSLPQYLWKTNDSSAIRAGVARDTNRTLAMVRDVGERRHGGEDEGEAGDGRDGAHEETVEPGLEGGREG